LEELFGEILGPPAVASEVDREALRRKVGVRLSTNPLRHFCATHPIKGGAEVRQVQKLLACKDINTKTL